jgi:hypothetical protein
MQRALEDAMAAVRAAADDRKAIEARRAADRERRRRADRARLEGSTSRDVRRADSRETHVSGFPPLLDGSPPPSVPSSPSPLSSPPSLFPPPSSAAPELRLEPQEAPRQARKAKPKLENPPDPRHAPLTSELVAAGWPHHGGRSAKAVSELILLAEQLPITHLRDGGGVTGEVLRRAAIARSHEGFPRVRELHELVTHWGHFAETPRGTGPPRASPNSGIMRSTASGCAACGGDGECARVGSDGVSLCYGSPLHGAPPGCMALWYAALDGGEWKPEQAAEWAAKRRET